ncbi:MAG: serine dehydratase beta chain, partial [Chitinophagaceae bacterium]
MLREQISVFDLFKICVGPSSSHTLGPWKAALQWVGQLDKDKILSRVKKVDVWLYGSLAKTGKGHGTDIAVILGLCGENPVSFDVEEIFNQVEKINQGGRLALLGRWEIGFFPSERIHFLFQEQLPFHPNALSFSALLEDGTQRKDTFYSIGGGFIIQEGIENLARPLVRF